MSKFLQKFINATGPVGTYNEEEEKKRQEENESTLDKVIDTACDIASGISNNYNWVKNTLSENLPEGVQNTLAPFGDTSPLALLFAGLSGANELEHNMEKTYAPTAAEYNYNFGKGAVSGASSVAGGLADIFGAEKTGNEFNAVTNLNKRDKEYSGADNILSLDYITNPDGLVYDAGNMVGSMAALYPSSFLAPATKVTSAAQTLKKLPFLRGLSDDALETMIRGSITSVPESLSEGGNVVRQAKEEGLDNPFLRGWKTAGLNLPALAISNGLEYGLLGGKIFKPLAVEGESIPKRLIKGTYRSVPSTLATSAQQGLEEYVQQGISNAQTDKDWGLLPWNASQDQLDSLLIGALTGALMSGAASYTRYVTDQGVPKGVENEKAWEAAKIAADDIGRPDLTKYIYSQWALESGRFTAGNANRTNNFAGLKRTDTTANELQSFDSIEDFAHEYAKQTLSHYDLSNVKNGQDFARVLYDNGYFSSDPNEYGANIESIAGEIQDDGIARYNMHTYDLSVQPGIENQIEGLTPAFKSALPYIGGILDDMGMAEGSAISSAYRTPEHNREVGGVEGSYHTKGDAVDIVLPDGITDEQAQAVKKRFEDTGAFEDVLFHDAGSGYHLHLEGYKGGLGTKSKTNIAEASVQFDNSILDFANDMLNNADGETTEFFKDKTIIDGKGNKIFKATDDNLRALIQRYPGIDDKIYDYVNSRQKQNNGPLAQLVNTAKSSSNKNKSTDDKIQMETPNLDRLREFARQRVKTSRNPEEIAKLQSLFKNNNEDNNFVDNKKAKQYLMKNYANEIANNQQVQQQQNNVVNDNVQKVEPTSTANDILQNKILNPIQLANQTRIEARRNKLIKSGIEFAKNFTLPPQVYSSYKTPKQREEEQQQALEIMQALQQQEEQKRIEQQQNKDFWATILYKKLNQKNIGEQPAVAIGTNVPEVEQTGLMQGMFDDLKNKQKINKNVQNLLQQQATQEALYQQQLQQQHVPYKTYQENKRREVEQQYANDIYNDTEVPASVGTQARKTENRGRTKANKDILDKFRTTENPILKQGYIDKLAENISDMFSSGYSPKNNKGSLKKLSDFINAESRRNEFLKQLTEEEQNVLMYLDYTFENTGKAFKDVLQEAENERKKIIDRYKDILRSQMKQGVTPRSVAYNRETGEYINSPGYSNNYQWYRDMTANGTRRIGKKELEDNLDYIAVEHLTDGYFDPQYGWQIPGGGDEQFHEMEDTINVLNSIATKAEAYEAERFIPTKNKRGVASNKGNVQQTKQSEKIDLIGLKAVTQGLLNRLSEAKENGELQNPSSVNIKKVEKDINSDNYAKQKKAIDFIGNKLDEALPIEEKQSIKENISKTISGTSETNTPVITTEQNKNNEQVKEVAEETISKQPDKVEEKTTDDKVIKETIKEPEYKVGDKLFDSEGTYLKDRIVKNIVEYKNGERGYRLTNDIQIYRINEDGKSPEWEEEKKYLIERLKDEKEKNAEEERKKKEKEDAANIDGFADDKTPLQRGRIIKALNKKYMYTGNNEGWEFAKGLLTRKDFIKKALANNKDVFKRIENGKTYYGMFEKGKENTDGYPSSWYTINKIEYEYASYLKQHLEKDNIKKNNGEKQNSFVDVKTAEDDLLKAFGLKRANVVEQKQKEVKKRVKIVDDSDNALEAEWDKLNKALDNLSANPLFNPEVVVPLFKIGMIYAQRGINNFANFSERMIEKGGERIKPWIKPAWNMTASYQGDDLDENKLAAAFQYVGSKWENGTKSIDKIKSDFEELVGNEQAEPYMQYIEVAHKGAQAYFNPDTPVVQLKENDNIEVKENVDGSTSNNTERDSEGNNKNPVGADNESEGSIRGNGEENNGQTSQDRKGQRSIRVQSSSSDTSRTTSDSTVRKESSTNTNGSTRNTNLSGSIRDSYEGSTVFDEGRTEPISKPSEERQLNEGNLLKQDKAISKEKASRLDDIKHDLPILLPEQQGDVLFAEERLIENQKPGVMFTNGTGTGKTYTGLGILKRFVNQGKKNILIVTPSNDINKAWIDAAKKDFDIKITPLENTNDIGKDVVVTTYANMGYNNNLVNRDWDLILCDESHRLMSSEQAKVTASLNNLRALTYNHNGLYERFQRLRAEEYKTVDDYAQKIKAGEATEKEEKARQDLLDKLSKEREELFKQWQEIKEEDKPKVVFLSATPFAYVPNVDYAEGYLFSYGEDKEGFYSYNQPNPYEDFFIKHFGYRMRYNKLTKPDADVNTSLMEMEFHKFLEDSGALSGRILTTSKDYDRGFILVDSGVGAKIDEGIQFLWDNNKKYDLLLDRVRNKLKGNKTRYILEAIKAKSAIDLVKEYLKGNKKVVIFHDFKKNEASNPFVLTKEDFIYVDDEGKSGYSKEAMEQYELFKRERPDLLNLNLKDLTSPINRFIEAFGDKVGIYNGSVDKKTRSNMIKEFNKDNDGLDVILIQRASGKEGISLHDRTGKKQRVLIDLGLPTRPTDAIQCEGRIYRVGVKSNAIFRYLNTGTNTEAYIFSSVIAERSSTAENLALGEKARNLKESFIETFEESRDSDSWKKYLPNSKTEGTGGVQRDRQQQLNITPFERAKSYYYANQKKTSKNKAREGIDYYPTPEPIGYKMVEFADIKSGDSVLEPSAGHGAIARFFPEDTKNVAIEPSSELANTIRLRFNKNGRVIESTFENYDVHNKFNEIVMNPPYGTAAKTAMEHLEKAFNHLRDGGRIVALLPAGNSMGKRLDKWLNGVPNAKTKAEREGEKRAVIMKKIELPSVTFERAGTKVVTDIYIIDKYENEADREEALKIKEGTLSFRNIDAINTLFDEIEDVIAPRRILKGEVIREEQNTPVAQDKKQDLYNNRIVVGTIPKTNKDVEIDVNDISLSNDGKKVFEKAYSFLDNQSKNSSSDMSDDENKTAAMFIAYRADTISNIIKEVYHENYSPIDYWESLNIEFKAPKYDPIRGGFVAGRFESYIRYSLQDEYTLGKVINKLDEEIKYLGKDDSRIIVNNESSSQALYHELGHRFILDLYLLTKQDNCPQQLKDDFNNIREWITTGEKTNKEYLHVKNYGSSKENINEEKFAESIIRYLYKGQTPINRLNKAIYKIKKRIEELVNKFINNYQTEKYNVPLNVEIPKKVKSAMDRLIYYPGLNENISNSEQENSFEDDIFILDTHTDTRNGELKYRVKVKEQMNFQQLKSLAKQSGGGYSRFAKGFLFSSSEDRQKFVNAVRGITDKEQSSNYSFAEDMYKKLDEYVDIREKADFDNVKIGDYEKEISAIGDRMGTPIYWFTGPKGFRGWHSHGTTYLNVNGNWSHPKVFWHETFHWIARNNPSLFNDMLNDMKKRITSKQINDYRKIVWRGDKLSEDKIIEEMMADSFYDVVKRVKYLRNLGKENKSLAKRFISFIRDLMNKFTDFLNNPKARLTTTQKKSMLKNFNNLALSIVDNQGNKLFERGKDGEIKINDNRDFYSISKEEEESLIRQYGEDYMSVLFDDDEYNSQFSADNDKSVDSATGIFKGAFKNIKNRFTKNKKDERIKIYSKSAHDKKVDELGNIGGFESILSSPARLAEKYVAFKPVLTYADNAMRKLLKNRSYYNKQLNEAFDYLENKDKDIEELNDLMFKGDALSEEYGKGITDFEKRADKIVEETGVKKGTAKAYIAIRGLLNKCYELINRARTQIQTKSEIISKSKLEGLKQNKFVNILDEVQSEKDKDDVLVTYEIRPSHIRQDVCNKEQLEALRNNEAIQILEEKEGVTEKDGSTHIYGDDYSTPKGEKINLDNNKLYTVKYREAIPKVNKLEGYVPHFFHDFYVVVQNDDGTTTTVDSGRNVKEAYKKAEQYLKDNENAKLIIRPKKFDFNEVGIDEEYYAEMVGDGAYKKINERIANEFDMSIDDVEQLLNKKGDNKNKVRRSSKHRFFGNIQHRTGAKGYEDKDLNWVLRHYFNSACRYEALETEFKPKAISYFERIYGRIGTDNKYLNGTARYIKDYINDVNGNPSALENSISTWLNNRRLWRYLFTSRYGERAALSVAGNITNKISILKLGVWNVSSAMLNLTQLLNTTALLTDKNPIKAASEVMKAAKDIAALKESQTEKRIAKLKPDERKAMEDTGVLHELGLDSGAGYSKTSFGKWGDRSMILFKASERLARCATILAAYRKARNVLNKNHDDAVKYARDINRKANFDYGVNDAPNVFRRGSIISQVLFQFMKYPIKQFELMRDFIPFNGKKDATWQQKATFWGGWIFFAGAFGLPAEDLLWALVGLISEPVFGVSPKQAVRQFLLEASKDASLPERVAIRTLLYGGLSNVGIDISSRVGMNDIIPGLGEDYNKDANPVIKAMEKFGGATGGTIAQFYLNATKGDNLGMLRSISPGMYNIYTAAIGESKDGRGRITTKYDDAMSRIIRGMGFKSTNEAIDTELGSLKYYNMNKTSKEKQNAIDDYLDAEERKENLAPYAKKLKELGVKRSTIVKARKDRKKDRRERLKEKDTPEYYQGAEALSW